MTYLFILPELLKKLANVKYISKNLVWIILFAMVAAAWTAGLFIDLTGDAGLYAAISRQMVESGDWLNLYINGRPYDHKPHLLFWLSGSGISLFGNNNFAFKFFPFLVGLSGVYFTYRFARLLYSETAGRLAALFTATSLMYFLYLHDIHTDTVLQAVVTLSLWQLTEYLKNRKNLNFFVSFLAIGLAMITKGPIGAFVPFLCVFIFLLVNKDYTQLFHIKWVAGVLIALLVASPVLYQLYRNFGVEGLKFYFIDNNIGRITGRVAGSNSDPFYYLHNLLWALLPWTLPVLAGLFLEIKSWRKKGLLSSFQVALLISIIITLAILSIARGKAPNYILMLVPSLIAIASGRLVPAAGELKNLVKAQAVVIVIMFLLLLFLLVIDNFSNLWLAGMLLVVSAFIIIRVHKIGMQPEKRMLVWSLLVAAVFNFFLNVQVLPHLFSYQGARQALAIYEKQRIKQGKLKSLHLEEYELYYWAIAPVEDLTTWEEFNEFLQTENPWVYTNSIGLESVKELTSDIDTIYTIPQSGMNSIKLKFLLPSTRQQVLKDNYLVKIR